MKRRGGYKIKIMYMCVTIYMHNPRPLPHIHITKNHLPERGIGERGGQGWGLLSIRRLLLLVK